MAQDRWMRDDPIAPFAPVRRITDHETCDVVVAAASRILADNRGYLSPILLTHLGWAAVPVITGLTDREESRLLQKLEKLGINELFLICVNPPFFKGQQEIEDYIYDLDLSQNSPKYFRTMSFRYLYFPKSLRRYPAAHEFVLLNDESELSILAGPKEFVEDVMEQSVLSAQEAFRRCIEEERSMALRAYLQKCADHHASYVGL